VKPVKQTWVVHLFAYLKERHGTSVEVQAGATAKEILDALTAKGINVTSCRLAVNNEFAKPETVVAAGSDLAVIPPVSGG
jgi:molybdopterin synthase catalytic subunit